LNPEGYPVLLANEKLHFRDGFFDSIQEWAVRWQISTLMSRVIKPLFNISSLVKSDIVHNYCVWRVINNDVELI